jgi:tRNA-uridine 2-sulfurtransferase
MTASVQHPVNHDPAHTDVIVGMSGGVDSSVAAARLVSLGYRVSGIFMQNWEDDDEQCTARQDYRDARAVANALRIDLETVNFAEAYWQRVFTHFLAEYKAGRTPNPDILCNREIKFKAFLDHATHLGADFIATGHYARVGHGVSGASLLRGLDGNKDQSYFLSAIGHQQIARTLFPVGEMDKTEVREQAKKAAMHVHAKKDSTGICFIGERKFNAFLSDYVPAQPGPMVDDTGQTIGEHKGLMFHTLGQRQGLGIGGRDGSSDEPWYVLEKDVANNTLMVGQGHNHPRLLRNDCQVHDVHWIQGVAPETKHGPLSVKVRYRQADVACGVSFLNDGKLHVSFAEPIRAVTPGQALVLYQGQECLGGGVISDFEH